MRLHGSRVEYGVVVLNIDAASRRGFILKRAVRSFFYSDRMCGR